MEAWAVSCGGERSGLCVCVCWGGRGGLLEAWAVSCGGERRHTLSAGEGAWEDLLEAWAVSCGGERRHTLSPLGRARGPVGGVGGELRRGEERVDADDLLRTMITEVIKL